MYVNILAIFVLSCASLNIVASSDTSKYKCKGWWSGRCSYWCGTEIIKVKETGCCHDQYPYCRKTEICCGGTVHSKSYTGCCNNVPFNTMWYECCDRQIIKKGIQKCCDGRSYDADSHGCCNSQIYDKDIHGCCKGRLYDSKIYKCCWGNTYNFTSHACCNDHAVYHKESQGCCLDKVFEKDHQICCKVENQSHRRKRDIENHPDRKVFNLPTCEVDGKYTDPCDCSTFFQCSGGVQTCEICPFRTIFYEGECVRTVDHDRDCGERIYSHTCKPVFVTIALKVTYSNMTLYDEIVVVPKGTVLDALTHASAISSDLEISFELSKDSVQMYNLTCVNRECGEWRYARNQKEIGLASHILSDLDWVVVFGSDPDAA